jgi:hypothetical protein
MRKNTPAAASLLGKDTKTFLQGGLSDLVSGIDLPIDALIPEKSEDFVQKVLKDTKGNLVVNEALHNIMHRFVRIAKRKGFNKIAIGGGFGMGKSLIKGNQVLLFNLTTKKVEDVRVGDVLMGPDSKPRKVLALGSGKEQAYKVTLKNGDSFSCNASHKIPFTISNRWRGYKKGERIIMTIQEYLDCTDTSKVNRVKIQKVTLDFDEQNIPMDAYVYGAWLGDGHKEQLTLTINDNDMEIAAYFFKWGEKQDYTCSIYEEKSKSASYALIRNGSKIANKVYKEKHQPLLQHVDDEKRIDKRYLVNSREIRLELLAGLIDTDGYLTSSCFEWSTKYIGLRDDFLFLCRSLGFSVSHRIKAVNGKDYYVVVVSGDTHLIPCKTRKKAEQRKQIKNPLVYGFDIEDIGEQEYFGFTLDGDHLYLQDDLTIHHNTENMCIGYTLHAIAKNPNILIKIVHVSDTEATKRCRSIRDYIDRDEDFHALAPHITPTSIWGSERFTVNRTSPSANCTVEAYSVLGTGIGGRANLIIFDDPQDLRTTLYEPTTRQKIEDTIKNIWLTRLIPDDDSLVLLMMNKWTDTDMLSYAQRNPAWAWMTLAVSEDKEYFIFKDSFGRNLKLPLWTKFDRKALDDRHITLGDRDFKRGYCLIPYTDSDKTFGHFEKCCHFGVNPRAIIEHESNWTFVGGIDFAGSKRAGTVLSIVAVHKKTGLKLPVEIVTIRKSSDLTGHIVRTYREYGVELYFAENNGVQEAIIDLLEAAMGEEKFKKYNIKIEGFLTGRGKMDINTGLPSMDKEFEKKEWMFCFSEGKPDVSDDMEQKPWSRMYFEMLNHPFYETSDIAMSLYFCREAVKSLIRGSIGGPQVY